MRILVYGAGVIGCELAHVLCRAGQDVTLLARGSWKETINKRVFIYGTLRRCARLSIIRV